jgi:hypothetical protein
MNGCEVESISNATSGPYLFSLFIAIKEIANSWRVVAIKRLEDCLKLKLA